MIPLQVIEMMVTTPTDRNQITQNIFVTESLIGQVMDIDGGLLAHDAKTVVNLQALRPPFLPFR